MRKHILITGARKGIGLEIAKTMLNNGYGVSLTTSSKETAQELASLLIDDNVKVYALDQSDKKDIELFVNNWTNELWGIVNNAGICKTMSLKDNSIDDPFEDVMNTNLRGPYLITKKLLPFISRPGRIVNITSQLGHEGRANYSAYCASKFALIGMTKCWAKELGIDGINVNAISPGWVDTEMSKIDMKRMAKENNISANKYYEKICNPLELKRFNSTSEVANLVKFLLSDDSSGITGRDWLMQTIWNEL